MLKDSAPPLSRRQVLTLLGSILGAPAFAAERIQQIDLFPAFLRIWSEPHVSIQERAQQLRQMVIEPNAALYEAFVGTVTAERLESYVRTVEPVVPAISKLHGWVSTRLDASIATFRRELPDFTWTGPLVWMPNLFGFDAGSGTPEGRTMLVFGLDSIAKQHGPGTDLSVLFMHELFHVYHQNHHPQWVDKRRGKDIPLYWLVWQEGLATYASQCLNPGAAEDQVLLSKTLGSACQPRIAELARLLLGTWDSTERGPFMEWMSGQARQNTIPPRAGYYLGLRIASHLGGNQQLRELARLPAPAVRGKMMQAIEALQKEA